VVLPLVLFFHPVGCLELGVGHIRKGIDAHLPAQSLIVMLLNSSESLFKDFKALVVLV